MSKPDGKRVQNIVNVSVVLTKMLPGSQPNGTYVRSDQSADNDMILDRQPKQAKLIVMFRFQVIPAWVRMNYVVVGRHVIV